MAELGFDPKGSESVKKAYVKNLIREANKTPSGSHKPGVNIGSDEKKGDQLSFPDIFKKTGTEEN